ncbi:hypothetical protein B0H11DRAFT_1919848 [Mycena galericulata]|nr:hypothetical protein B0H11DRAFT_1919848 [Mycena galericulata]
MPPSDTESSSESSISASMSQLSLHSSGSGSGSQPEDWDRSLSSESTSIEGSPRNGNTPRNSVVFPSGSGVGEEDTPGRGAGAGGKRGQEGTGREGKRSLSELLRLHAEKGTASTFSAEEAARVADVLRDWINASSSPYEDEDDFFASTGSLNPNGNGHGHGNAGSRPPSAAGTVES